VKAEETEKEEDYRRGAEAQRVRRSNRRKRRSIRGRLLDLPAGRQVHVIF
jgi:hypothetical protein